MTTTAPPSGAPFGTMLRTWRVRRRFSQLDLAATAEVSARHVSFLETGRSTPSRDMVIRLADVLDVPLREQNALLVAAGWAPAHDRRPLDHRQLQAPLAALRQVLAAYGPFPALVVDRSWDLVDSNEAVPPLLTGVAPHLLEPPANVLRLSLHPDGLAPRIANLAQWRGHLLHRLDRQVQATADPDLHCLLDELRGLPGATAPPAPTDIAVPLHLRVDDVQLNLLSTVTTFGTATDLTLAELSLEAFLPGDHTTAAWLDRRP